MPPSDLLKWLSERRDGFLVAVPVLYLLGYLVWSYNAWRNGLGPLPALEFQYFTSGLIPAVVVLFAFAGAHWFTQMQKAVRAYKNWSICANILFYIFLFSALYQLTALILEVFKAIDYLPKYWHLPLIPNNVSSVVFTIGGLAAMLIENKVLPEPWWLIFRFYLAIWLVFNILGIYLEAYSRLPQVFGGPRPRCAYVDIVRSEV